MGDLRAEERGRVEVGALFADLLQPQAGGAGQRGHALSSPTTASTRPRSGPPSRTPGGRSRSRAAPRRSPSRWPRTSGSPGSYNPLRKVKEAILTRQVEDKLSKRRILEIYLNVAEFGEGIYGAEAAARHYYRRSAAASASARPPSSPPASPARRAGTLVGQPRLPAQGPIHPAPHGQGRVAAAADLGTSGTARTPRTSRTPRTE